LHNTTGKYRDDVYNSIIVAIRLSVEIVDGTFTIELPSENSAEGEGEQTEGE